MKIALVAVLLFTSVGAAAHGPDHHHEGVGKKAERLSTGILHEVKGEYESQVEPVFKAKCFDCHSSSTKYPWYHKLPIAGRIMESHIAKGRSHLDMSKGFPFVGHGGARGDLKEIIRVVEGDVMPPWYYTPFHSASKLTKFEKQRVLSWARSSLSKLENQKRQ